MTYCIGIKANDGIVFASDKDKCRFRQCKHIFENVYLRCGRRSIIIVTSGNLGTSQAVYKSIENDLKDTSGVMNLNTCKSFDQIASYWIFKY